MNTLKHLMEADPEIYNAVRGEMLRQEEGIELIASENFVSRAVLETAGTSSRINTLKAQVVAAITADVRWSISLRTLRVNVLESFSVPNTQMFSRTQAHRRIWRSSYLS